MHIHMISDVYDLFELSSDHLWLHAVLVQVESESDVGDIKRARQLLVALTDTNPRNHNAWVARARLEEKAGKIVAARKLIKEVGWSMMMVIILDLVLM
jgi:hypothetical protein